MQVATQVVASLLALDSLDPEQEIKLYINCPQVLCFGGLDRLRHHTWRRCIHNQGWKHAHTTAALGWPPHCLWLSAAHTEAGAGFATRTGLA